MGCLKKYLEERIPPEFSLMLAMASGDAAKIEYLLRFPIDWEMFLQMAIYHRVAPYVYKTLNWLRGPALPENVWALLRAKYRENTLRALNMTGETIRIVSCLEACGIRVVVLKGAPLAWVLYGDVGSRSFRDIDILISPGDVVQANQILEKEGYRKIKPEVDTLGLTSSRLQKYTKTFALHHIDFRHNQKGILLELHWSLSHDRQVLLPMPPEDDIKRIRVAGNSVPVLPPESQLLYLVFHGASHAWSRMFWLVDLARLMQKTDWQKSYSLAEGLGIRSVFHQAMILCNDLLGMAIPQEYRSVVLSDRQAMRLSRMAISICLSLYDHESKGFKGNFNRIYRSVYNYRMSNGWRDKFNYVLSLFALVPTDIGITRLVPLPEKLYALYYVIRPITVIYGYCRKNGPRN